ncbi:hypothetical protein [Moorena producens]|uniref:hypothetical protein n=1 Tax=Moorena producens TaxID=1155739 RepID=UPI003C7534E1
MIIFDAIFPGSALSALRIKFATGRTAPYSLLPIPYSLLPVPYSLFPDPLFPLLFYCKLRCKEL